MTDIQEQQQEVTVSLMDDTAFGADMEVPYMEYGSSIETPSSCGELAASESNEFSPAFLLRILAICSCYSGDNKSVTVPHVPGHLTNEIEEFFPGVQEYIKNIFGRKLSADTEEWLRQLLPVWNTFLQPVQGVQGTSAIISSDIMEDINKFIPWLEERLGAQWTEENKKAIKRWLPDWNIFLQARAGETLVTRVNLYLTIVGFIFYMVDLVSDIGTSMYYTSKGQWWRAVLTLTIVYAAIIIHTAVKWINKEIHCTGVVDWLLYVASLLVNWPDVIQYGALCQLEWKLHKSPANSARLVPEWNRRRFNVAHLKYTEGVCEACPQAILQLYLLVPDLYGDWSWTDYLRIAGASVSLCTAGAALVNREKLDRILSYTDVPLSELVVLHVWAVPVTVSRLLSVTLLLSVHPYWVLAGVALHLVLPCIYWCRTEGVPRTLYAVFNICINTIYFFISPFLVAMYITPRRVLHAIHFLVNTAAMVVWAISTPMLCANPTLYTAIICFNAVMFAVGLVGWQLHENYWPRSYFSSRND